MRTLSVDSSGQLLILQSLTTEPRAWFQRNTSVTSNTTSLSFSHGGRPSVNSGRIEVEHIHLCLRSADSIRMKILRRCTIASTCLASSGIEKLIWLATKSSRPHQFSEVDPHQRMPRAAIHRYLRKSVIRSLTSGRRG